MSTRKTDRDIQYEAEALHLGERLPGQITIAGGGRKGPFTLTVHRLGRMQVRLVADAVVAILNESKAKTY